MVAFNRTDRCRKLIHMGSLPLPFRQKGRGGEERVKGERMERKRKREGRGKSGGA